QVLDNIRRRDSNDRGQWAALLAPGGAIRIDTTHLPIADVVDTMLAEVRRRQVAPR
ncbi:MAG: (d)CMP kinase, partial [Phycisphaerae bacterium]